MLKQQQQSCVWALDRTTATSDVGGSDCADFSPGFPMRQRPSALSIIVGSQQGQCGAMLGGRQRVHHLSCEMTSMTDTRSCCVPCADHLVSLSGRYWVCWARGMHQVDQWVGESTDVDMSGIIAATTCTVLCPRFPAGMCIPTMGMSS